MAREANVGLLKLLANIQGNHDQLIVVHPDLCAFLPLLHQLILQIDYLVRKALRYFNEALPMFVELTSQVV